jgi:hypothetical protein
VKIDRHPNLNDDVATLVRRSIRAALSTLQVTAIHCWCFHFNISLSIPKIGLCVEVRDASDATTSN